jgi:hypothetical protein
MHKKAKKSSIVAESSEITQYKDTNFQALTYYMSISYVVGHVCRSSFCFTVSCLFCEYLWYEDEYMWSVVDIYCGIWLTLWRFGGSVSFQNIHVEMCV